MTTEVTYSNPELSSRVVAVAIDESFGARDAFMWAISNLRQNDTLLLLHCVPDPMDYAGLDDEVMAGGVYLSNKYDEVVSNPEEDKVLCSYKTYCSDRGINCRVGQVIGHPDVALLPAVEVEKCDLVVVGSAGKSRIERTLLGSTGESTVHNAHCPVVVVKSDHVARILSEETVDAPSKPRVVCIGFDNTQQSKDAFSWAVDNYLRTTDQVWLVHVQTEVHGVWADSVTDDVSEQFQLLSSVLDSANISSHNAMRVVSSDDVSLALTNAVRAVGATTLLMGCRGRGYFKRVFFGSVSDGVVRNAPCDVIVVKEGVQHIVHTNDGLSAGTAAEEEQ